MVNEANKFLDTMVNHSSERQGFGNKDAAGAAKSGGFSQIQIQIDFTRGQTTSHLRM